MNIIIKDDKRVTARYKVTLCGAPGLREAQGRPNWEGVQTSLEKVCFCPPHSGEVPWFGQAGAGLELLGSSRPPTGGQAGGQVTSGVVGSGVPAPVLAGGLQSMSAAQGLWFPCGKGCRKVTFRLRLRDQRTTMLWVGACTGSTKCPQPLRQLAALPLCVPAAPSTETVLALCSL